jgi:acetone carboxylase gamma subunit
MIIHDYLEVDEKAKVYKCASCKQVYCELDKNYKEYCAMQEGTCQELVGLSFADIPAGTYIDNGLIFRIFYCPKCGGMVTTEAALKGDPVLPEMIIRL